MVAARSDCIGGVFAAAIAPRRASGHEIDLGLALEGIDFLNSHPIRGIVLLGSTGEFIHYDFEERMKLVALAAKRSRAPVVASITHSTLDGTIALAEDAADAGVAAVLVMPPYYFRYDSQDLREFYSRFSDEFEAKTPVYLYNIPFFTSEIPSDVACELLAAGRFAGIKDSSGRMDYFEALIGQRATTPFTLMIGNDTMFVRGRRGGADGVVSGVASALPELLLGLERAIMSANTEAIAALSVRLDEFIGWIERFPTPVGVREAARMRGVKIGPSGVPLGPAKQALLGEFEAWFKGWLPAMLAESK